MNSPHQFSTNPVEAAGTESGRTDWQMHLLAICVLILGCIICVSNLQAQTPTPEQAAQAQTTGDASAADTGGPAPTQVRAVRLSYVEGTVQMLQGDKTVFSQASMNMPIVEGTRINTGEDGKAEIEFEDGSVARLAANSSLNIDKLHTAPDGTLITQVSQLGGLVYYELRQDAKSPFTVLYGTRKVTLGANSTFRMNMDASPASLAVLDGEVQVTGGSGYVAQVHQGQTIRFNLEDGEKYAVADAVTPNGWDKWNDSMDEQAATEAQNQTAARSDQGGGGSPVGYGWGSLDNYGSWYPVPGYGDVWQPSGGGDAGFDPYGYGAWGMMPGMGYSWISGYPWGWLPFHYGGWAFIGGFGWGWMPGFGGGFGGYGGYGGGYGYGYGGGFYPYSPVYNGPGGYAPVHPPTINRPDRPAPRNLIPVGHAPANGAGMMRIANGRPGSRGFTPHSVDFNGTKLEPLHSVMGHVQVPMHNAALYNDHPATAFHGNVAGTLAARQGGFGNYPTIARAYNMGMRNTGAREGLHSEAGLFSVGGRGGDPVHSGFGTHGSLGSFGGHGAYGGSFHGTGVHSSSGGFHGGGGGGAHMGGGGGFHGGGAGGGGGHAGGGGGGGGGGHH